MVVLSNYIIRKQKLPDSVDRCINGPYYIKSAEHITESLYGIVEQITGYSKTEESTLFGINSKIHYERLYCLSERLQSYEDSSVCVRCGSREVYEYGLCRNCSEAIDWKDFDDIFNKEYDMTNISPGQSAKEITYTDRCCKALNLIEKRNRFKDYSPIKFILSYPFFHT